MFRRKTVITFEKMERYYLRVPEVEMELGRCQPCGQDVRWLTPHQTVALTGLSLREVFRRIEADAVHVSEMTSGLLLVCQNSLLHITERESID